MSAAQLHLALVLPKQAVQVLLEQAERHRPRWPPASSPRGIASQAPLPSAARRLRAPVACISPPLRSGRAWRSAAAKLSAAQLGAGEPAELADELAGGRADGQPAQGAAERPPQLFEVLVGQVPDRALADAL
jgi:hypothetical protein